MGKQSQLRIKESLSELKKIKSSQKTLHGQKRLSVLISIKESKFATRQQLADSLGVHIRTMERWLIKYREAGISEMVTKQPRPRASKIISKEIHQGLEKRSKDPLHPFLGYWEAQRWVQEVYGVDVHYHWLRTYMIQHFGTSVKRPRKIHVKQEPQAKEAFLKTTR